MKRKGRKRREGKWIKMKGTATRKPTECYYFVSYATPFSKAAVKIVKGLQASLSKKENPHSVRTWESILNRSEGALRAVTELRTLAQKHKLAANDVRLSRVGAEYIYLDHLASTLDKTWIHSSALNGFLQVTADAGHVCFGGNPKRQHSTWVLDTFFYDLLTGVEREEGGRVTAVAGYQYEKVASWVRKADLTNITSILIPINLNNAHWIAARISVKEGVVEIMDSLCEDHPAELSNVTRWYGEVFGMVNDTTTHCYTNVQKQINDDCGVYTAMFILKHVLAIEGDVPWARMTDLRGVMASALLTGVIDTGYRRNKVRPPKVRQKVLESDPVAANAWTELEDNPDLLERYQFVAGDLLDRPDYDMERIKTEIEKTGSMEKWLNRHEKQEWKPLEWERAAEDKDEIEGQGCTVVTFNVGPRGIRRASEEIARILRSRPGVLHLQDIRIPRNKVGRLRKSLAFTMPEYVLFTNIKEGFDVAAGTNVGVGTLIRTDLAESAQVLPFDNKVQGRVLAISTTGMGAAKPTIHVNCYQHVNEESNLELMRACLDVVYHIVATARQQDAQVVMAGDLNAALSADLRWNYVGGSRVQKGDDMLQEFVTLTGGSIAPGHRTITFESSQGPQQGVIDHVLHWPPDLRVTGGGVMEPNDSRHDHKIRWVTYNGNDLGFEIIPDRTKTEFVPKLDLKKWAAKRDEVTEQVRMKREEILRDATLERWPRLHHTLAKYKVLAADLTGWTKKPTGGKPFVFESHGFLHREVQAIRECRKEVLLMKTPLDETRKQRLTATRTKMIKALSKTKMTKPAGQIQVDRDSFLTETKELIAERVERIDREIQEKQREMFKEIAARLRSSYGQGGNKTMKKATGKFGISRSMWAVETDHPDSIRIRSQQPHASVDEWVRDHDAVLTQAEGGVRIKCAKLDDFWDLVTLGFKHHGSDVTIERRTARLVTSAGDRLCGQEKFFGENALSKQACCATCGSTELQGITRVHMGKRRWGVICKEGHWGDASSIPRDFTTDEYGVHEYSGRVIPHDCQFHIRGSISREDFAHLLDTLPNWKSPGDDQIPCELLKGAPEWLVDMLREAVNDVLEGGSLPADWKYAIIKLIQKKAPASKLANQRPVCCARTVYKLVSAVINNRMMKLLRKYDVIEPIQEGFQQKKSCQRQVLRLLETFQDAKENGKQLYCLFLDFGNAFNSIDHEVMWRAMELSGFHQDDIRLVAELYKDSTFGVENDFGTTAPLPVRCGVKQGDIISPTVFSITMNVLLRKLAGVGRGYAHSAGVEYNVLAFADDLCLLADSAENMQLLVNQVQEFADWSGMWVNVGKSEVTAYDFEKKVELEVQQIRYKGKCFKTLKPTQTYKYLGFHVSLLMKWDKHKASVIEKMDATIEALKDTLYLSTQVEEMIRVCVVPLFRYSAALVPWTATELAHISTKLGMAIKQAWKVTKHCGRPVLVATGQQGGWNAPAAEALALQESWGLLQQAMQHGDDVGQLVEWRLGKLLQSHGADTVGELQEELLQFPDNKIWLARLMSGLRKLEVPLRSRLDSPPSSPSLNSITLERRQELDTHIASFAARARGVDKDDRLVSATLSKLRQERGCLKQILTHLRGRGITHVHPLIGSTKGVLAPLGTVVERTNTGLEEGYAELTRLVYARVGSDDRKRMYVGRQKPVTDYYHPSLRVELTRPTPRPRSDIEKWLDGPSEGRAAAGTDAEILPTPPPPPTCPFWDDRISYDRLQTVVGVSQLGRFVKCRFRQQVQHRTKRLSDMERQEIAAIMVRNRATIQVADKSKYWPTDTGWCKVRVEGYKRFKLRDEEGRMKRLFCFMGIIVDSSDETEIGCRIDKGLPVWGPNGVVGDLDNRTIGHLAWRGEEWVDALHLGCNADVNHPIHPLLVRWLCTHPQVNEQLLDLQDGDRDQVLAGTKRLRTKLGAIARGKGRPTIYPPCFLCRAEPGRPHGKYLGGGSWIGCPMEQTVIEQHAPAPPPAPILDSVRWGGTAVAAEPGASLLSLRQARPRLEAWELPRIDHLVEVDLSSVENAEIERERDRGGQEHAALKRNNLVTLFSHGKQGSIIPFPQFQVLRARHPEQPLHALNADLGQMEQAEKGGRRVLSWACQDRLCMVDGAQLVIGIHPACLSPHVQEGWGELDPTKWSEAQQTSVESAGAMVVVLSGEIEVIRKIIAHLRPLARNNKILFVTSAGPGTPMARTLPDILPYAKDLLRFTAKLPIWQAKGQWMRRPGYTAQGGHSATVWAAGPRDEHRSMTIKGLSKGWSKQLTESQWQLAWGSRDPAWESVFTGSVEAREFDEWGITLAATDGSVAPDGSMGAGVAFADSCPVIRPPISIRVGGPAASLRAEAAALLALLEVVEPGEPIIVLTDSLGLLQIIRNWFRYDFAPLRDYHEHHDLLVKVMRLLAQRTAMTKLVKVKSHSGIPLNEEADTLAQVQEENELRFAPQVGTPILEPRDIEATPVQMRQRIAQAVQRQKWEVLRAQDNITARTMFTEHRGQRFFAAARGRLSHTLKRRMLQVLGGVFPCNLWKKRINVSDTDKCALCGHRDTYSHRVCACSKMHDAITKAHDEAWKVLYEVVVKHLPSNVSHWYDTRLASIPLRNLARPIGSAGKYKPDAVVEDETRHTIHLLEFARTTDLWSDSLDISRARKHDKRGYKAMIEALQLARPGWRVELRTFVLGDRGFFDEMEWNRHWEGMSLPPPGFKELGSAAVQAAYESADLVLTAYKGAITEKKAGA